jgi:hypothetical protein
LNAAPLPDRPGNDGETATAATEPDFRGRFYDDYIAFKSWDGGCSGVENEAYAIEMGRTGIEPPASLLEIGFGEGRFLDWAAARGYSVTGVEIIEPLVEAARRRGHRALHGAAQAVLDSAERFDLIVAFDVLEHLTVDEIVGFFRFAGSMLNQGGRLIARFPNGSSPFGLYYQNGDITHITVLSAQRIFQIATPLGFELLGAFNAARPLSGGGHSRLARKLRFFLRDALQRFFCRLYLNRVVPLDPNLTVVLRRASAGESRPAG